VRAEKTLVDRVAAVVNEDMVTLSEVHERAAPELARRAQEGTLNPSRKAEALQHALDELIAERLLGSEQRALNIEVSDQELDYAVDDVRKQNSMDAAAFEKALSTQGQSLASYREKLRKDLAAMKLIGLKVRSKIKVSDEDVKAEYARKSHLAEKDVEIHARHIVIQVAKDASAEAEEEARKRAESLAARARSGEDFAELAKAHSEGPSKADGGDVGFFKRGDMVAAFDRTAFTLKDNEVSDPVRTPFGWHVIKVMERRAAASKPFEQVREELRDKLWREQMQRQTEGFVEDLRKQASVEIKLPELKSSAGPKK
jgi:peptidyl-prolyl cis-trans isomerase SurA